ncbi:MAG: circularly permuted type 2 ATP-grasp protein, partial [Pseudomonadota bacterium]
RTMDVRNDLSDMLAVYGAISPRRLYESFTATDNPRTHLRSYFDSMARTGADGLARVSGDLDRLRAESGIAFAAEGRPQGADCLPVILAPGDWHALEPGILQRARLAEAALADLYGESRMVREGVLPPGLVYAAQGFAPHCAAWDPPVEHWMYVYEADIARAADGRWIILADRMDTPLGDGWMIANRIAYSEAFADPFVALAVRRLASHYTAFQDLLDSLTGWEGRLGLVTGGEKDPRFFSHAYFARYLNANLIEPADITVREGAAFVKTLAGLKKLDILLRGVRDIELDALHRPKDNARGAPALSIAMRSGQLTLANAIGVSAMAYRGLAPYAHRLCEELLQEELLINDAPCLWLGKRQAREQVIDEREYWRIEPLNRRTREEPAEMPEGATDLRAFLQQNGERFAATATPPLAHTPCWEGDRVVPGEWMMRVFACRTREGWSLAPGGVASHVAPGRPPPELDFGKDVWVLPDEAERAAASPVLLSDRFAAGHLRRTGRDLLSRVADELYWLGRNAERAEQTLRVLNVAVQRYLSGNRTDAAPEVLCEIAAIQTSQAQGEPSLALFRDAVRALISSNMEPWGMPETLRALRTGAVRARSAISEESWRYIDRLCTDPRWGEALDLGQPAALLRMISDHLGTLAAFAGSQQENLTRNYAWRFLEMGRRIERGYATSRVAERLGGQVRENEESYLRAWLMLSDSASAYRSRYMMTTRAPAVIDLLVLDEANPRSLVFQIERLEGVISMLPSDSHYRKPEHRKALALLTEFRLADAEFLASADERGGRQHLHTIAVRCREDLMQISNLLSRSFFAHADLAEAAVSQARLGEAG